MSVTNGPKILVLASKSERRKWLLESVGFQVLVQPSNTEEILLSSESPKEYALRLAMQKLRAVHDPYKACPTVAADTIVILGSSVFGKPKDQEEAINTLKKLSNQIHTVMTAYAVAYKEKIYLSSVLTQVRFRKITVSDIERYLEQEQVMDKAGAYSIQSAASLIDTVQGSLSNVIGLPLAECLLAIEKISI